MLDLKSQEVWDLMSDVAGDIATVIEDGYPVHKVVQAFDSGIATSKMQSTLDNTNLTIQKGQECVDAMSSPSKIDTEGRRGVIGDDWEDNKLTSRDNAATTATSLDKIFQNFRPEWTVVEGTPEVSSGQLVLLGGSCSPAETVSTPSSFTTGTWEEKVTTGSARACGRQLQFIYQDADNLYNMGGSWGAANNHYLGKTEAGSGTTLIDVSGNLESTTMTRKATRDSAGNFEMFKDGASEGTASDDFLPDVQEIRFTNSGDDTWKIWWLKVY